MLHSLANYKTIKEKENFRWDGEFLCFEPFKNFKYQYLPIGDILVSTQYGISINMNEDENGYKIYRMNEISNMFCNLKVDKYADIDEKEMKKFVLKDRDVLFNRTNSLAFVGRTGIFKKFSNEPLIFASYLVKIRPDQVKILPEYLTTFLNTKYGIQDIKRRARISINQSNVSASELQKIEMPSLSINFQNQIKPLFDRAFQAILDAQSLYAQTEHILFFELGLTDWQPKNQLAFTKCYSDIKKSGRTDAEHFQPKYEEIVDAIKSYSEGWDTLGNLTIIKGEDYNPQDNKQYKYIELSNVGENGEIIGCMVKKGGYLPSRARRKIITDDVIVSSIEGSLSSIAIIENEYDQALCSTGFHIIHSEFINSATLLILLKSIIGQLQLKKGCSGTILTAISNSEFNKIVLPKIKKATQTKIRQKIIESFALRKQSKYLLECAKRAVEIAIEEDEKTARTWLKKATKE